MSDSSATVIIIFVIFLLMAGGGTAAWYFLYYKPRQSPAPAPAYVSPPTPIIIITPPPASAPSTDGDGGDGDGGDGDGGDGDGGDGDGGDDDYDPLELGEVVSPAGSPSAAFSLALWRSKMKKKFGKNRTVLQKRLEVLEAAVEAGQEMSGSVPSEHFDDAIKYIKDLLKKLPRAPAPKGPFVYAKWKTSVVAYFEKKTIDDVQSAINDLKAAKKKGLASKNDVPKARYDDAIKWLGTILKKKENDLEENFDLDTWKVRAKNELKGKKAAAITARIDRLKDAQTEKLTVRDGVPRSQYNEAIAWLRVLETEAKKPVTTPSKKFNLAAWKTATQKKLKNKSRVEIQRVITRFEKSTAAVHDGVPEASKARAVAFLKSLKAKALK